MIEFDQLLAAWDGMDNATQRMLVALPEQMTAAAARLDAARLAMRKAVNDVALRHSVAALRAQEAEHG